MKPESKQEAWCVLGLAYFTITVLPTIACFAMSYLGKAAEWAGRKMYNGYAYILKRSL